MKYLVTQDYFSQYPVPILINQGDKVKVGERFTDNPEWPGWIWCENGSGEKGWVPERIIKISGSSGIVLENYSAVELTVKTGEFIEAIRAEGGWFWCRNVSGLEGWIPEKNVKLYEGD